MQSHFIDWSGELVDNWISRGEIDFSCPWCKGENRLHCSLCDDEGELVARGATETRSARTAAMV